MPYHAEPTRYDQFDYTRTGRSGLKLPPVSLGLWQNFGGVDVVEMGRAVLRRAFDRGVTHFDLANNYGPPHGSAEENFGQIYQADFLPYRDELILSTKAGFGMWPGPYGDFGSRKYLLASLDQSLKRMKLDYVDIFYHHRMDEETPLEESMGALAHAVRAGKALYVGISNYSPEKTRQAAMILKDMGVPLLIHQPQYSMLNRTIEHGLLDVLGELGVGCIPFSPLHQGLLTSKYLGGIPEGSRATRGGSLPSDRITPELVTKLNALNQIAKSRGQSLAQLAIRWVIRDSRVTSALVGARNVAQLDDVLDTLASAELTADEIHQIDTILQD